jgi:phospholipid/cholesterol/gamma-HCH transport system ATP-binding protein
MTVAIEMQDVHKAFGSKQVLRGLSFRLEEGKLLVVLGQSGTGKSVTLKHLVGLLQPDRGRVLVQGVDVATAEGEALAAVRRQVSFLFQSGALVNWMTVRDNVALPLVESRRARPADVRAKVDEALQSVELAEAADQLPEQISGGMRKRAALARALVQEPAILLYDEPTSGLDPILGRTVAGLILKLQSDARRTAIVVTHDLEIAFHLAASPRGLIGLHDEGQLVEVGPLEQFRRSRHPVIRAFLDGGVAPPPPPSR